MGKEISKSALTMAKAVAVFAALVLALVVLAAGSPKTAWAEWPNTATITLKTASGDTSMGWVGFSPSEHEAVAEREYHIGEECTVYCTPAPGYSFFWWGIGYNGQGFSYDNPLTFTVQGDFEFVPVFVNRDDSIHYVNVDYYVPSTSGGNHLYWHNETILPGEIYVLPECTFDCVDEYKTFNAWLVSILSSDRTRVATSFSAAPGTALPLEGVPEGDIRITPMWKQAEDWCHITFASGDGARFNYAEFENVYVKKGSTYTLPDFGYNHGDYRFVGWDAGNPGDEIVVRGDMTITAKWEPVVQSTKRRLTVITNDSQGSVRCRYNRATDYSGQGIEVAGGIAVPVGETVELWGSGTAKRTVLSMSSDQVQLTQWSSRYSFVMPDEDVTVSVEFGPLPVRCLFLDGGGSGQMEERRIPYGTEFVMPECAYTPPPGKVFDGWAVSYRSWGAEYSRYEPGDVVIPGLSEGMAYVSGNGFVTAPLWKDAAHDHVVERAAGVEPGCDTPGYEPYWKCSICGKLFSDEAATHEIAAPVEIAPAHDWGEWTVTKPATTTEEGEKTRVCKRDPSHTETAVIPVVTVVPEYSFVTGAGASWAKESEETFGFVVKRSVDDDTTLAHFMGASVDGTNVPPLGYDVEAGSLVLTLKPAYLESLDLGAHKLRITFDDGEVETSFTILEAGSIVPGGKTGGGGLPTWAWILIGVAGAALVAFLALVVLGRRRQQQQAPRRAQLSTRSAATEGSMRRQVTPRTAYSQTVTPSSIGEVYRRPATPTSSTDETVVLERVPGASTGSHAAPRGHSTGGGAHAGRHSR